MKTIPRNITKFTDWLYKLLPFVKSIMPLQTFRYAVCGGVNLTLITGIYHLLYRVVFNFEILHIGSLAISSPVVAHCIVFVISLFTGFYLNSNVAFRLSPLKSRTQFVRYTLSNLGSLGVSYMFLKLFLTIGVYPTLGEAGAGILTAFVYSYPMQKYFSFRGCE